MNENEEIIKIKHQLISIYDKIKPINKKSNLISLKIFDLISYISNTIDILVTIKFNEEFSNFFKEQHSIKLNKFEDYEDLLRKEENEIRFHIKNNNILKIENDYLNFSLEKILEENNNLKEQIKKLENNNNKLKTENNKLKKILNENKQKINNNNNNNNTIYINNNINNDNNNNNNNNIKKNVFSTQNNFFINLNTIKNKKHNSINSNSNISINFSNKYKNIKYISKIYKKLSNKKLINSTRNNFKSLHSKSLSYFNNKNLKDISIKLINNNFKKKNKFINFSQINLNKNKSLIFYKNIKKKSNEFLLNLKRKKKSKTNINLNTINSNQSSNKNKKKFYSLNKINSSFNLRKSVYRQCNSNSQSSITLYRMSTMKFDNTNNNNYNNKK